MAPAADRLAGLSEVQRQELESLLLEFDQQWHRDAISRQIKQLPADDDQFRQLALLELAKIDLERHWQSGSELIVEEYLRRFPELGSEETVAADLLFAEYEARRLYDNGPAPLRDFQMRFPGRFAELRQLVEQNESSVSAQAASEAAIDTSRSGRVSDTRAEGRGKDLALPKEFGRYRILRKLGEGGMGSVYLAHDTELDRQVALKVPKFEGGEDRELIERFYREARAAANLRHASICPVHDVGEVGGTRYISMAYIEGRPLSAYIRRDGSQSERQVALVVRKLAVALEEAHKHGVVHRDLKPANIMIDEKKEPVIMDFGLARQLDKHEDSRLTQQGTVMGSPAYMSPEQVAGDVDRIGPPTDIYSLGVILFELLTGRAPFEGPMTAVLGQILTQQSPSPSEFRKDLDLHLDRICSKMMAKRIEDRHGSMQEVSDALTEFLKRPVDEKMTTGAPAHTTSDESREPPNSAAISDAPIPPGPRVTVAEPRKGRLDAKPLPIPFRVTPKMAALGIGLAALIGVVLLGVVLAFRTPHGTVRFEVSDPNLTISIDGSEYSIAEIEDARRLAARRHQLSVKLGDQSLPLSDTVRLSSGRYDGEYRLRLELDGVEIHSDEFEIVRGGEHVVTVRLEPASKSAEEAGSEVSQQIPPETTDASDDSVSETTSSIETTHGTTGSSDEAATPLAANGRLIESVHERYSFREHEKRVGSIAFSPDGMTLAAIGVIKRDGTVALWETSTGKLLWSKHFGNWRQFVLFSPDGSQFIIGTPAFKGGIQFWDLHTKTLGQALDHNPESVRNELGPVKTGAMSSDGSLFAAGQTSGLLRVWDPRSTELLHTLDGKVGRIRTVTFHPTDVGTAAVGGKEPQIQLWDLIQGQLQLTLEGHVKAVNGLAFHPDGHLLASASDDATVKLWDAATGELRQTFQRRDSGKIFSVDFHRGGSILVTGDESGTIAIWRVDTGQLKMTLEEHDGAVRCVAFSPDGSLLASAGDDSTVRLWDVRLCDSDSADEGR